MSKHTYAESIIMSINVAASKNGCLHHSELESLIEKAEVPKLPSQISPSKQNRIASIKIHCYSHVYVTLHCTRSVERSFVFIAHQRLKLFQNFIFLHVQHYPCRVKTRHIIQTYLNVFKHVMCKYSRDIC